MQPVPTKPLTPSASLYVGDLHPDVTEAFLYDLFKEAGSIISIRVCRDAVTRESLGYAYVNFANAQDAERAMDSLNFSVINDKPIRIMWSQRDPSLRKTGVGNVFIKNLDTGIDNKALRDTFSAFGKILSCKVQHKTGRDTGVGYVHFATKEAADKAIEKVDGMQLNGKIVKVEHYVKRPKSVVDDSNFTNCYVKNLGREVNNEKLTELFATFGKVQNATVMTKGKESAGFGFVNFFEHEGAAKAVEELNGKEHEMALEGKNLVCCRAMSKQERSKLLREKFQKEGPPLYKHQGTNVYVKHLEESVDEAQLKELFKGYGKIQSVAIMTDDKTGLSRGFGFVNFTSSEEATKAITEMNDKMIGSKPLFVALAQPKEVRRQQLMAKFTRRAPHQHQGPVFYQQNQNMRGNMRMNYQHQYQRFPGGYQGRGGGGGQQRGFRLNQNARNTGQVEKFGNYQKYPQQRHHQQRQHHQRQQHPQQQMPQQQMPQQQMPQQQMPQQQMPRQQMPQQQVPPQQQQRQQYPPQNQPQQMPVPQIPTLVQLTSMDKDQVKVVLGEILFPMVMNFGVTSAEECGKITGMLLEMETQDLVALLHAPDQLLVKVREAAGLLSRAKEGQQGQGQ